nr:calpain-13 [Kogia breviceps]
MAHNLELLAKTPIIKFKQQDFYSLRDYCLNRGLLSEDETFPAETYSVGLQLLKGRNLSSLSWMRPKDLLEGKSEAHFILEGASSFDIQQGEAGDCWFLAALGSLTQNPQHLQKILMDQSFSYQYAGIFRFPFWQCGLWVEVVVDDRLPVLNDEYFFVNPRNKQECWPSLPENACAKFHGSYVNLHYGYLPDALVDLTGGVVTNISLHSSSSDLLTMVKMVAEAGSLMTCSTLGWASNWRSQQPTSSGLGGLLSVMGWSPEVSNAGASSTLQPSNSASLGKKSRNTSHSKPTSESTGTANGLVSRHGYTVTGAGQLRLLTNAVPQDSCSPTQESESLASIQYRSGWEYLIRLWNPWGKSEWRGCGSDRTERKKYIPGRESIMVKATAGLGWALPLPPDRQTISLKKKRTLSAQRDSYTSPGEMIAGPQRDMQDIFSVPESMENNNVIVSFDFVMPQNLKAKDRTFPLKSEVFKIDYQFQHFRERLPSTFFSKFTIAEKGIVSETTCNLTERFSLSPGTCVAVVSAGRGAVEFLLQIFLKMPDSDRNLDNNLNLRPLQGLDIDATQVQSLLNQEFLKDETGLGPCSDQPTFRGHKWQGWDPTPGLLPPVLTSTLLRAVSPPSRFSPACPIYPLAPRGRIRRPLPCSSSLGVFQNSRKNSGVFLSSDLWKAIKDTGPQLPASSPLTGSPRVPDFLAGISVPSERLDLMRLRYSDGTGRVSFPSLVCVLMRLEAMTGVTPGPSWTPSQ